MKETRIIGNGNEQNQNTKEPKFPGVTDKAWIYDPEMNNYRHVSEKPAKPKIS